MEEYVLCHEQLEPGLASADAQIVVLEKAEPKAFVKAADSFDHLAPHEQAKPCQPLDHDGFAGKLLPMSESKRIEPSQLPIVANNMLSIILDPAFFGSEDGFSDEIRGLIDHVKSSKTVTPRMYW